MTTRAPATGAMGIGQDAVITPGFRGPVIPQILTPR